MPTLIEYDNMVTETIREASALTTDYVASNLFDMQGANILCLELYFTKGSSTGFRIKIEKSNDLASYSQECESSQSGGVTSYTPNEREFLLSGNANLFVEIPMTCRSVKVSAKALTSGSGTSLKIVASRANV